MISIKRLLRSTAAAVLAAAILMSPISCRAKDSDGTAGTLVAVYEGAKYEIALNGGEYIGENSDRETVLTDRSFNIGENGEGWLKIVGEGDYTANITLDLGRVKKGLRVFFARMLKDSEYGCDFARVSFYCSENGSDYEYIGVAETGTDTSSARAAAVFRIESAPVAARYVRAVFECSGGAALYINELGVAARGSVFYSAGSQRVSDDQGVVYRLDKNGYTATAVGLESRGASSAAGTAKPSEANFNANGKYVLGQGTDNEVNVIADLIDETNKNRSGIPNGITKIMIHNTGTVEEETDAQRYNYRMHHMDDSETSWHYTVDKSVIYHSLADDNVGWHAGSSMNYSTIGVEICSNGAPTDKRGNPVFSGAAYESWLETHFRPSIRNAAVLTAELLIRYRLSVSDVVQHYDSTGKECPQWMRYDGRGFSDNGILWGEFIALVKSYYKELSDGIQTPAAPADNIVLPDYIADRSGHIYTLVAVEEGAFDVSGTSAAPSVSYGEHITETAAPKSEDSGTKVSFWVWAALVIIAALALAAVVTLSMRSAAERRRRKYRH